MLQFVINYKFGKENLEIRIGEPGVVVLYTTYKRTRSSILRRACRLCSGSIGFAVLNGKIYINHLEYISKNLVVKALRVTVAFNWWFTKVRMTIDGPHTPFPL